MFRNLKTILTVFNSRFTLFTVTSVFVNIVIRLYYYLYIFQSLLNTATVVVKAFKSQKNHLYLF